MQSFTTSGVDPRRKLAYWNERAGESFSPLVSDPADIRAFHGSIERTAIGELTLAEACTEAQTVRHSRAHVARTRGSLFFLMLQLSRREPQSPGRARGIPQARRLHPVRHAPSSTRSSSRARTACWCWESRKRNCAGTSPVRNPWSRCRCARTAASPPCSRASCAVSGLACHQDLDPQAAARVSGAVLDLLGATYTDVPRAHCERSAVAATQRIRILDSHRGAPARPGAHPDPRGTVLPHHAALPAPSVRSVRGNGRALPAQASTGGVLRARSAPQFSWGARSRKSPSTTASTARPTSAARSVAGTA